MKLEEIGAPLEGWTFDARTGDIYTPSGYMTHAQHLETALWLLSANVAFMEKKPIFSDELIGHVHHMYDVGDLAKKPFTGAAKQMPAKTQPHAQKRLGRNSNPR